MVLSECSDGTIVDATDMYNTPFYMYSLSDIRDKINALKHCLPARFELAVSLKANPNPHLLAKIKNETQWLDIASVGEFYLGELAGVPAEKMIFIGPGKTHEELDTVIKSGIGLVVVESIEEIHAVNQLSGNHNTTTNILIRVNPTANVTSTGIQMSGVSSQFGIDEEQCFDALDIVKNLNYINFMGIHVYMGSQILSIDQIYTNFKKILQLAKSLIRKQGVMSIIDFGGGFGVPYIDHEKPLDLRTLGLKINRLFDNEAKELMAKGCRFIVESGRYIFAEAGIYVAQVLYKKTSMGKNYLILDGGSNFHSTLSGMGKIVRQNFPFYVINRNKNRTNRTDEKKQYDIVGPLCTPKDTLATSVNIADIHPGDLVVFEKSGAYGLSFSQNQFLSHTGISEILLTEDETVLIKKRKDSDSFRYEYNFPMAETVS